jgi:RNase H-like domain found in reverse transcriptase
LGFDVSAEDLKPAEALVDKMLKEPRPITKKQLRSLLGLVGFYRRFVAHFASVAAPLTDLTKKGTPSILEWGATQQNAFIALRKAIASQPVLCLPDYEKPFQLQTDASDTGLGAVLLQEYDGLKHPIAFASRKLLPREQNYATIERECLAIVWGINKFDNFLYGKHFLLEVDHEPLKYLNECNFKNGRLTRWALSIQPYRFTVIHIKGSDNVGADFLSRHCAE